MCSAYANESEGQQALPTRNISLPLQTSIWIKYDNSPTWNEVILGCLTLLTHLLTIIPVTSQWSRCISSRWMLLLCHPTLLVQCSPLVFFRLPSGYSTSCFGKWPICRWFMIYLAITWWFSSSLRQITRRCHVQTEFMKDQGWKLDTLFRKALWENALRMLHCQVKLPRVMSPCCFPSIYI